MIDEKKERELKDRCLVYDIETKSVDGDGRPVDIKDFDRYVKFAKPVFFGGYSYAHQQYYLFEVKGNEGRIIELLEEHDILIGFNNEQFDDVILKNNGLWPDEETEAINYDTGHPYIRDKRMVDVDCMLILGKSVFLGKDNRPMKNRGALMGYDFINNKLSHMAEVMRLEARKGDIDYNIFYQDSWTKEELDEIYVYLKNDIDVTKQMFERLFDYWKPLGELIDEKYVNDLSWIRNSIASLTYKAACHAMGETPTYGEKSSDEKREMGGRVLEPVVEEAEGCWIVDISSLYPHMMVMFNLFSETENHDDFHGNDVFETKGYYDITKQHILGKYIMERLKYRMHLKKTDPDNPMTYTLKIIMNGLYGCTSSEIFEKLYSPNIGWDTCYLGQQVIILAEDMMKESGFTSIYSDTDSLVLKADRAEHDNKQYVRECLDKVEKKILDNVPFPTDTFGIEIENECPYMMFPFIEQPLQDEEGNNIKKGNRLVKVRKGRKKFYVYLFKKKDGSLGLKIKGLPIIKNGATLLGKEVLEKIIKPLIMKRRRAKFTKEEMDRIMEVVLHKEGSLEKLAREFRVKPLSMYKNENQLQAQISKGYFNGDGGSIALVKNKKVGRVGKTMKYATPQEMRDVKLKLDDIDLEKFENELEPFILYEEQQPK